MKRFLPLILLVLLGATGQAQWQTTTYTLKGGWNSIYLYGDASHATMEELFTAYPEVEGSGAGIPIWSRSSIPVRRSFLPPAPPSGVSGSGEGPPIHWRV